MHEHYEDHDHHDHNVHLSEKLKGMVWLLAIFVAFELIAGFVLNGKVVATDAFHNVSDVLSMGLFRSAIHANGVGESRRKNAGWLVMTLGYIVVVAEMVQGHGGESPRLPGVLLLFAVMSLILNIAFLRRLHSHRGSHHGFGPWLHQVLDIFVSVIAILVIILVLVGHPGADLIGAVVAICVTVLVAPAFWLLKPKSH